MRPRCTLLLLAFAACHGESSAPDPDPPPLTLLPGTGLVAIEMNGTWQVAEVVVVEEAGNATQPLGGPAGFMPPVVGATLRIEGDQVVAADDRDLRPAACGSAIVRVMLNHVDGRRALYYRSCRTPSPPGLPDSGGGQRLQFALGSVDADTMTGLVQHNLAVAFPPRDRPMSGLYRVTLHRRIDGADAPR